MIFVLIMRMRFAVLLSLAFIAAVSCSRSWPSRFVVDMASIYHVPGITTSRAAADAKSRPHILNSRGWTVLVTCTRRRCFPRRVRRCASRRSARSDGTAPETGDVRPNALPVVDNTTASVDRDSAAEDAAIAARDAAADAADVDEADADEADADEADAD